MGCDSQFDGLYDRPSPQSTRPRSPESVSPTERRLNELEAEVKTLRRITELEAELAQLQQQVGRAR